MSKQEKPPSREDGFSNWLRGPATTETDIRWSLPFDRMGTAPMRQGASTRQVLGRLFGTFAGVTFRLPDAAGGGFLNSTDHRGHST
jgi:hypothetical protein